MQTSILKQKGPIFSVSLKYIFIIAEKARQVERFLLELLGLIGIETDSFSLLENVMVWLESGKKHCIKDTPSSATIIIQAHTAHCYLDYVLTICSICC